MALTNNQITAQNFKDFYGLIKPYLGYVHAGYTPIGTVISVIGDTAPQHYLLCDGTVYNIADYAALASYFESQFGSKNYFGGNGTTTFAVPNLLGGPSDTIYCIAPINIYMDPSNSYSLEEQVIGTWIDGKPLYQRVYVRTSSITLQSQAWTSVLNMSSYNIDSFVHGEFGRRDSSGVKIDCMCDVNVQFDSNNLKVMRGTGNLTCANGFFVIFTYTKTTD